ncbi:MAG: Lrp/AsnC ligand binding domain-containing protein [Planctomycetes bacterium]|nr:Lrp/AsnC ligand binding domain-containing protein [Planctomycetota bacterium]
MDCEIDSLDLKILRRLQEDSRKPFLEIARDLSVSGGTIHARINKMRRAKIIQGSKLVIDYETLGYKATAFMGVRLARAGAVAEVQDQLKAIPEVVEIHYTTGTYSLLIKVIVPGMNELYRLLLERLQGIEDVQSTETFVVLKTALARDPEV